MKKILFSLFALVFLLTGCKKDPDVYVTNITNITEGTTVYTEYPVINRTDWTEYDENGDGVVDYIYASYENEYIDEDLINNSFVIVYWIDDMGRDVALPYPYKYYSTDGNVTKEHTAIIRYDVEQNYSNFMIEALDGDYYTLERAIGQNMCFKVCMMLNPQVEE